MQENGNQIINKNMVEIVHNDSIYYTMKKSNLKYNDIIKISPIFSVADITNIDNYIVDYPNELFDNFNHYDFSDGIKKIKSLINNSDIRIWCSYKDADSYILLCYLVCLLKDNNCSIFVAYSDEYKEKYYTPAFLNEMELVEASKLAHKLSDKEINNLSNKWTDIKNKKCDIRIIINKEIKLVNYNYFDDIIIKTLEDLGICKVSKLVGTLMEKSNYFIDLIYVILIEKLINAGKIKLVEQNERYFNNIISL